MNGVHQKMQKKNASRLLNTAQNDIDDAVDQSILLDEWEIGLRDQQHYNAMHASPDRLRYLFHIAASQYTGIHAAADTTAHAFERAGPRLFCCIVFEGGGPTRAKRYYVMVRMIECEARVRASPSA